MANRIQQIADDTRTERDRYLAELGWATNPFANRVQVGEYVMPSEGTIADVTSAIDDYTGPILIHSPYSGVGKTTLMRILLDTYDGQCGTSMISEHNVTAYELASIIADDLDIGKSNSTKLTERRLRESLENADRPVIIGIDEFGLNDPDTIHVIQFVNDLPNTRVIITGMTSQWDALKAADSDERAFTRRVSLRVELDALDRDQAVELYKRRVANASGRDTDDWDDVPLAPLTDDALDVVHDRSQGVPAVITSALAELVGLAAFNHDRTGETAITAQMARSIDYADPHADETAQAEGDDR